MRGRERIENGGELLVIHADEFQGLFSRLKILGSDRRHSLSDETDSFLGQHRDIAIAPTAEDPAHVGSC